MAFGHLVFIGRLFVGDMSCTLKGGHRPLSITGIWLCLCSALVSGSRVGACLAIFEEFIVGGMSCTFEGGLRPPSFLIDMWFCTVFCVGFLFINRGMSCITLSLPRGFALCSILVSCSAVGTYLVFSVSLVVEGMSCTLEGGLRPPSF